jgi:hypothetical protein
MALSNHNHQQKKPTQRSPEEAAFVNRFLAEMQESTDIFCILTPLGEMQKVSPHWQNFTGQQENESRGKGWLEVFHPADQPQVEETLIHSVVSGHTVETTCHIRRHDGTYCLMHVRVIPVHEASGALREIVMCGTDTPKQELSGLMSEAQVQLAVNASGVGMWDWNLVTNQLVWTDQKKALFGLPPETPISYERFLKAVHPDDRERVHQLNLRAIAEQQEYRKDYRTIWPNGSVHWLSDRARILSDGSGKQVHIMGATVDITELKHTEQRLREANQQVTSILESITDAFSHVDTQWRYTYVNQGLEKMMGKKREEILGRYLWDMVPAVLGTPFEQTYREAMATQQTRHIEGFHPDFQRWVDIRVYPTPDGLSFYLHDITERKQAEEALRESEARFRGLVDSNIIGIIVSDQAGTIREANDAFLALVGSTREDLATGQMQWAAMTPPEYQARHAQAIEELLTTGKVQPFEKELVAKGGKRVPVLIGRTLFHREGSAPLVVGFVLDQTARKEIERQKDLFLGMTSHELKTPLAALKGTFQLLQRRVKRLGTQTDHLSPEVSAFLHDLLERLAASARQVDVQTHLINDLLDVSRITANTLQLELDQCDLTSIVRETVEDLRVTAPSRSLVLDVPEHPTVMVLADRARISQVVTNYLTNAIRYSSADQPIHIGLSIREDVARVWVRDQGPGLSAEAQKELWQRFHQVKDIPVQSGSGKGLGLGLYICQMLIAQHQGEVGVESTPGEGSTFWFTLPLVT